MDLTRRSCTLLMTCLLTVAAAAPYLQVAGHEFIAYDDAQYLTENPVVLQGLTWEGIRWAVATFDPYWHPLTWLSHMLDCTIYRRADGTQWPGGHLLTNVIIHVANTLILFALLHRTTASAWRSALVAAIFAVHPLQVESVAWIAERKNVLTTLFGLLTLWSYARYVERATLARYAAMTISFAMALMCKPMLVTLPCLMVVLDYWPLARLRTGSASVLSVNRSSHGRTWPGLIIEKLPLFGLSAAVCVATVVAQRQVGAAMTLEQLSIAARLASVPVAYVGYLSKIVWPEELAVLYPHPYQWPLWRIAASTALLIAIAAISIVQRRKRPYLIVGWLWFLGTLVPVIGVVQVGWQWMADRYSYVPLIGIAIMIAWSAPWPASPDQRSLRQGVAGALALTLIALVCRTWVQVGYWRDSVSLWARTAKLTQRNFIAHNNLGYSYQHQGKLELAIDHLQKSVEINPRYALAHANLGNALSETGDLHGAERHFRLAMQLQPSLARQHTNFGAVLLGLGKLEQAIEHYRRTLEVDFNHAESHNNLGWALMRQGKLEDAIAEFEIALRLQPGLADAHLNMGMAQAGQGRLDNAIAHLREALRLQPDYPGAQDLLDAVIARQASSPDQPNPPR